VTPGERTAGPQAFDSSLENNLAAAGAGARAEVHDVIGNRDDLRLVLNHEDRVALVSQPHEQVVHPLDVVRVQPDRRLVEHVRHVSERRAEVTDHPGALRLTAGQRA
jgi:hypothetical protein